MNTLPTEPIPSPPRELPPSLPPDLPQPPIEEPEPDVLPDEVPNPNPEENEWPPKHTGPKDPKKPVEVPLRKGPIPCPTPSVPSRSPDRMASRTRRRTSLLSQARKFPQR